LTRPRRREWVTFFLRGIAEQALDATVRAKRLHDLRESLQERAVSARAPALAVRLAARLIEQPVLTISGAEHMLQIPYHNARRQVHRLVALGLLAPFGSRGHQELYIASEVMEAVED
jgi:Fic family protein